MTWKRIKSRIKKVWYKIKIITILDLKHIFRIIFRLKEVGKDWLILKAKIATSIHEVEQYEAVLKQTCVDEAKQIYLQIETLKNKEVIAKFQELNAYCDAKIASYKEKVIDVVNKVENIIK